MKVFIIGGSSGIGLSLAKRYLSLGNEVAICGTNDEKLKKMRIRLKPLRKPNAAEEIIASLDIWRN